MYVYIYIYTYYIPVTFPIISLVITLYPIHFTNYIKLYGQYFRPLYPILIQLIIYILPELSSYCIIYVYIYILDSMIIIHHSYYIYGSIIRMV